MTILERLTGSKTVEAHVQISAKPETVWAIVSDAARYAEWNPVHVRVEGTFAPNGKVTIHLREPTGKVMAFPSTVRHYDAGRKLNQRGGTPGIFTFDHTFELTPTPNGTRFTQREVFAASACCCMTPAGSKLRTSPSTRRSSSARRRWNGLARPAPERTHRDGVAMRARAAQLSLRSLARTFAITAAATSSASLPAA